MLIVSSFLALCDIEGISKQAMFSNVPPKYNNQH